jgi:hypothetical protein
VFLWHVRSTPRLIWCGVKRMGNVAYAATLALAAASHRE